jgi:Carboxypeptidase regulatory-like domain
MKIIRKRNFLPVLSLLALLNVFAIAQSISASLTGAITDEAGGAVTKAAVTLKSINTGLEFDISTDSKGYYSFLNLPAGDYELKVTANGFQTYTRTGIRIALNEKVRLDLQLKIGAMTEVVQVTAEAPQINRDDATQSGSIEPKTVADLPLIVEGSVRSSAEFAKLLPGVVTPDGSIYSAYFNGGALRAGEAILNGVTMVNPSGGGAVSSAGFDFAQSPDMVSELKLLSGNYEPQYGTSSSTVIIMETKAGTSQFHGNLYEYHRNTVLNANQFPNNPENRADRPINLQNNFGGSIGGPVKLPFSWFSRNKGFFFVNWEGYRVRGGVRRDVLSIPSLKQRQGDFSDWINEETGELIPIYDPATTRRDAAGNIIRDQFMGCDGNTPNVICPSDPRLQNSLALQWLRHLPDPTNSGTRFNFLAPAQPGGFSADANILNMRFDQYIGDKDHFMMTIYKRNNLPQETTLLPPQLSTGQLNYKRTWISRASWDHTFSPSLINHFAIGYNHDHFYGGGIDVPFTDELPKIPGVGRNAYPPAIRFLEDDFDGYGTNQGSPEENSWPAPAVAGNNLFTWVKGQHTLKFGVEYRHLTNSVPATQGEAGEFRFGRGATALGANSGSPIASFLLEQVEEAQFTVRNTTRSVTTQTAWIAHVGDTWRVFPRLSLNYGLRWESMSPVYEKYDFFSYLDPTGPNPSAGNRPGRLVFAGDRWGDVSSGRRYPEDRYLKGFSPRVGIAYSPREDTVVRLGYGIFIDAGYVPGWGGGVGQDGFNITPTYSSTENNLIPAFKLSDGPPQNFPRPPFLDPGFLNGQTPPTYRPMDGNRPPYSQQWNLTIERQATNTIAVSLGYVGNKGTRLISHINPINALHPSLLAQYGSRLNEVFQPGQTSLHGVPIPYAGWVEQMSACAPTLAQALLPFPQYCTNFNNNIYGANENVGNSTYHSLQLKVEKQFSRGVWFLSSYTFSKMLTNADTQQPVDRNVVTSPFEQGRTKGLGYNDVPHSLSIAMFYDLPFGRGKRWLTGGGVVNHLVGGWRMSNILRFASGNPFYFRSSFCNVPTQFAISCFPGLLPGANPWAQDKGDFDPSKPLLNRAAFEQPESFDFSYGSGAHISNLRGFGYKNHDFALSKDVRITEGVSFQFRAEFFNLWNNHRYNGFDTDINSSSFGQWNGSGTPPRNIQLAGRITF